jgi:hypothetical protein
MSPSPSHSSRRSFEYHARAQAFFGSLGGANVESGVCTLLPVGGFEHLHGDSFQFPDMAAVATSHAETMGFADAASDSWNVKSTIAIEGFSMRNPGAGPPDAVSIGRMAATVVSSHPSDGRTRPTFSVPDLLFSDVRIMGVPVQIETDHELYSLPLSGPTGLYKSESLDLVRTIRYDSRDLPSLEVDRNEISVPGNVSLRLADLWIEPDRCYLRLARVGLWGDVPSGMTLGILSVGGTVGGDGDGAEPSSPLDEEEEAAVFEELRAWVNTHPKPDEPFLFFMGRSLTPVEFSREAEEKSDFGVSFLQFLSDQSKRFDERPRDAIRRAVDANRAE